MADLRASRRAQSWGKFAATSWFHPGLNGSSLRFILAARPSRWRQTLGTRLRWLYYRDPQSPLL